MHKYMIFLPIFHQSSRQQKLGVFISDNWYDAFTKKYYFQLECCYSIFSLLSRAPEYINTTEVLSYGRLQWIILQES